MMVFCAFLAFTINNLWAEVITINLSAEITQLDDRDGMLNGQLNVGDSISGSYTYDSATPDSSSNPSVGVYWHDSRPYGITLTAGGFVFQSDPCNVEFLVEMVNDYPGRDNYLIRSYNNLPLSEGICVEHIAWQLNDGLGNAVSSDALPTSPPVLDDWSDTGPGLTIQGRECPSFPRPPREKRFFIRANVTSVEVAQPLDCEMQFTPQALNCKSKGNWLKAHVTLPDEILPQDIDVNTPAVLEPAGIESTYIDLLGGNNGPVHLEIVFDRKNLCDSLDENGLIEIELWGRLNTGQYFVSTDTIKVSNCE